MTGTFDEGMAYIEGFIAYMEGTCANCTNPAMWEIGSHIACCTSSDIYCQACGRAKWYQSGLFGIRCSTHRHTSQVTYHPRKIGGSGPCMLCQTGTCPVWDLPATP